MYSYNNLKEFLMARQKKQAVVQRDIASIVNNPSDNAKLKGFLDEAVLCRASMKNKQEDLRGIVEAANADLGIEPKLFNALVRVLFNNSFDKTQEELSDLEVALEALHGKLGPTEA
jgi:hypothetical protein